MKILVNVQNQGCVDCFAEKLAKFPFLDNSEVLVLHVVQPVQVNSYTSFLPLPLTEELGRERLKKGTAYVEAMKDVLKASIPNGEITGKIVEGAAKMEIMEVIKLFQPDLVIMGNHGKTGLRTLGSVSLAITTNSECSVLVIPIRPKENDSSDHR
ncbi:MAG: universal stress protein [Cyanobacteria bacterium]|nr:universal stress protein [Cyanobacteriota bacterium]